MRLPLPWGRWNRICLCTALLCAAVIILAVPRDASAWHGDDDWRPRHHVRDYDRHDHHEDWDGRGYYAHPRFFLPPPPFGVRVYPGYPVPHYRRPCRGDYYGEYEDDAYYSNPPRYVPTAPFAVSLGFQWVFRR